MSAPIAPGEFNDDKVAEVASGLRFRPRVKTEFRMDVIRFFRFYVTGSVEPLDQVSAVILNMVKWACVDGKYVFPEQENGEFFYPENTSKEEKFSASTIPILKFKVPTAGLTSAEIKNLNQTKISLAEGSDQTFIQTLLEMISNIKDTEEFNKEEDILRNTAPFLALTFLRFAVKDVRQMSNAFQKRKYKSNLEALAEWPSNWDYYPPCAVSLKKGKTYLNKAVPAISQAFYVITHRFVILIKELVLSQGVGYLGASLLAHTARNGLGLIDLLDTACRVLDWGWTEVMKKTLCDETVNAWDTIVKFYSDQLTIGRVQRAYNWARIMNHNYFKELSPKKEPFLAVILAGIIEKERGTGLWKSNWYKTHGVKFEKMKMIGNSIYEDNLKFDLLR